MAWPDSWNATMRRSLSLMTRFFSRPAMTRSIASSKSFAVDGGLVAARGEQRRLVDEVGEVGAGESRGPCGDDLQLHVVGDLDVLDVDAEDFLAALDVGLVDQHLAVEAARAQQGRVEHLGPVGRGHDDDALAAVEAVHLREQLVERLLALVVAAHRRLDADLAERVELVDEDDAGRLGFGLLEQVAHAGGADADEHLDEVGAAQAEERHRRLAGDGAGEQRLAGAGRADEQHALGNASADAGVLRGVLRNSTISRSSSSASSTPATSPNLILTSSSA